MMKRILLVIFSVFASLLMISTVSAVPKVNSDPLMDKIAMIEEYREMVNEEVNEIILNAESGGIIDLIRQIIEWLINFVEQLISIILSIFGLVDLIETLIGLIMTLYEMIMALINFILNLFNPNELNI